MTTEQKAKAYDEAIKKAKEIKEKIMYSHLSTESCKAVSEYIDTIIPELAESKDERIRKDIISHFESIKAQALYDNQEDSDDIISSCNEKIAWLEKQKEQSQSKSVLESWKDMRLEVYQQASGNRHEPNYSDDTTKMFSLTDIDEIFEKIAEKRDELKPDNGIHYKYIYPKFSIGDTLCREGWANHTVKKIYVDNFATTYVCENEEGGESHISLSEQDAWDKMEKTPAEWSEEEKRYLDGIVSILEFYDRNYSTDFIDTLVPKYIKFLNSLHPSWKPSKEQMEALSSVINYLTEYTCSPGNPLLISLYHGLKKLL